MSDRTETDFAGKFDKDLDLEDKTSAILVPWTTQKHTLTFSMSFL